MTSARWLALCSLLPLLLLCAAPSALLAHGTYDFGGGGPGVASNIASVTQILWSGSRLPNCPSSGGAHMEMRVTNDGSTDCQRTPGGLLQTAYCMIRELGGENQELRYVYTIYPIDNYDQIKCATSRGPSWRTLSLASGACGAPLEWDGGVYGSVIINCPAPRLQLTGLPSNGQDVEVASTLQLTLSRNYPQELPTFIIVTIICGLTQTSLGLSGTISTASTTLSFPAGTLGSASCSVSYDTGPAIWDTTGAAVASLAPTFNLVHANGSFAGLPVGGETLVAGSSLLGVSVSTNVAPTTDALFTVQCGDAAATTLTIAAGARTGSVDVPLPSDPAASVTCTAAYTSGYASFSNITTVTSGVFQLVLPLVSVSGLPAPGSINLVGSDGMWSANLSATISAPVLAGATVDIAVICNEWRVGTITIEAGAITATAPITLALEAGIPLQQCSYWNCRSDTVADTRFASGLPSDPGSFTLLRPSLTLAATSTDNPIVISSTLRLTVTSNLNVSSTAEPLVLNVTCTRSGDAVPLIVTQLTVAPGSKQAIAEVPAPMLFTATTGNVAFTCQALYLSGDANFAPASQALLMPASFNLLLVAPAATWSGFPAANAQLLVSRNDTLPVSVSVNFAPAGDVVFSLECQAGAVLFTLRAGSLQAGPVNVTLPSGARADAVCTATFQSGYAPFGSIAAFRSGLFHVQVPSVRLTGLPAIGLVTLSPSVVWRGNVMLEVSPPVPVGATLQASLLCNGLLVNTFLLSYNGSLSSRQSAMVSMTGVKHSFQMQPVYCTLRSEGSDRRLDRWLSEVSYGPFMVARGEVSLRVSSTADPIVPGSTLTLQAFLNADVSSAGLFTTAQCDYDIASAVPTTDWSSLAQSLYVDRTVSLDRTVARQITVPPLRSDNPSGARVTCYLTLDAPSSSHGNSDENFKESLNERAAPDYKPMITASFVVFPDATVQGTSTAAAGTDGNCKGCSSASSVQTSLATLLLLALTTVALNRHAHL